MRLFLVLQFKIPISNPESQAPNLVNNMKLILTDFLPPASKYKTNIAVSILQNKPVQMLHQLEINNYFLKGYNQVNFGRMIMQPLKLLEVQFHMLMKI